MIGIALSNANCEPGLRAGELCGWAKKVLGRHGVVCFGGEDWWYHNRGHADMQYMRQLAVHGRVLYVNSVVMRKPNVGEGRMFLRRVLRKAKSIGRGVRQVGRQMWVYSPLTAPVHHLSWLRRGNSRLLRTQVNWVGRRLGFAEPLVWVNCPAAAPAALAMRRRGLVYQRTDRFEDFPGVDRRRIAEYDAQLKAHADLVFYSNRELFESEKAACRHAAYVDHGVDYEHFAEAHNDQTVPPELADVARPIAGFFGGIDDHTFDLPLVEAVVAKLPDIMFVFVGGRSIDCSALSRHANVKLIDRRPYDEVPHYGKCFDVCLMPWRQNEWIAACNPIKLKEYLALGKPIVSTPFPELRAYASLVDVGRNPDEFAAAVRLALARDQGLAAARREFVRAHSWERKASTVLEAWASAQSEAACP